MGYYNRRGEMVAGHLQQKKGYFYMVLNLKDENGKRKTKWISTGLTVIGNKRRAEAMLLETRKNYKIIQNLKEKDILFADFMRGWLDLIADKLDTVTYDLYANSINNKIYPYFIIRRTLLKNISFKDIQDFCRYEVDGGRVNINIVLSYCSYVKEALDYAVENKIIKINPININLLKEEIDILFADFMVDWLEMMKNNNAIALSTYASYSNTIKRVIYPYFKEKGIFLKELTAQDIQQFYQYALKERKVTTNTALHYHANIRKALKHAVQHDMILTNPADKVVRPRKNKFKGNSYNQDELNELFKIVKNEKIELAVLAASVYGLRRSEVVGLKWKFIDFNKKTITIGHTVTEVILNGKIQRIEEDHTKNISSYRTLPLVSQFEELLLILRKEQEYNKKICGDSYNNEFVEYIYVDTLGNRIKPGYITQHFASVLKKHGLRKIRFHDLRHSCATLLLLNGIKMKAIQEWLGHSDFSTTANLYVHLDYSEKLESANVMNNVLKSRE